jgi:glycosyltransferase involved in cell wall biosynthesis
MPKPLVSIIVPVLNAENKIPAFIKALKSQDYPSDQYEIIIVDNGSADQTAERVKEFLDVSLLERSDVQNPYAARNAGLKHAKGDILALLDVNCTPVTGWLTAGLKRLSDRNENGNRNRNESGNGNADLAGGHISFTFSADEGPGEWYDSLLFVDMEDLIKRGQSCAGGNLFFKRRVLKSIGYFPENRRSGGDLYWTKKATNAGFTLVYEADAKVTYPARALRPLLKKVYRVGTGQPVIWLKNGMHPLKMGALIFYQLVPPGTKKLHDKIERRGKKEMNDHFFSLWLIHYIKNIVLAAGWGKGLLSYYFS